MRKFLIILVVMAVFSGIAVPKAKAMDPITISVLAPYAIPVAEMAGAFALKGFCKAATGIPDIFYDMVAIFMLPVGFLEATLGAPFGLFGNGCENVGKGVIAPFKLCYSTVMLFPLFIVGMCQ
ncbi:MAG: hypothetical protein A2X48_17835 [Lentisphaerae bacterium GWF2_49_21]|nr:MAG: hypothetical protein A2X48_17835 [Lentisphaerae bacterium GWF2_49_21]